MRVYFGDPAAMAAALAIEVCGPGASPRVWIAFVWWCAMNSGPAVC